MDDPLVGRRLAAPSNAIGVLPLGPSDGESLRASEGAARLRPYISKPQTPNAARLSIDKRQPDRVEVGLEGQDVARSKGPARGFAAALPCIEEGIVREIRGDELERVLGR